MNYRFFLTGWGETSETGCLAVHGGLTAASLLVRDAAELDEVIFQDYLLLVRNFACKYFVLTVMFLNYCYDNHSFFLKPDAISQFAPDISPLSPASKFITHSCDVSSAG